MNHIPMLATYATYSIHGPRRQLPTRWIVMGVLLIVTLFVLDTAQAQRELTRIKGRKFVNKIQVSDGFMRNDFYRNEDYWICSGRRIPRRAIRDIAIIVSGHDQVGTKLGADLANRLRKAMPFGDVAIYTSCDDLTQVDALHDMLIQIQAISEEPLTSWPSRSIEMFVGTTINSARTETCPRKTWQITISDKWEQAWVATSGELLFSSFGPHRIAVSFSATTHAGLDLISDKEISVPTTLITEDLIPRDAYGGAANQLFRKHYALLQPATDEPNE